MSQPRCAALFLTLLLLPAASAPLWAGEKPNGDKPVAEKPKEFLSVEGNLSEDDPADKVLAKSKSKVHTFKMEEGQGYRIDLRSNAFDSFLRLEDPDGKCLAQDDDGGGFPHSRLIHQAAKAGEYRVIVTSFDTKIGEYTLKIVAADKLDLLEARSGNILRLAPKEQGEALAEIRKHIAQRGKDVNAREANMALRVGLALEQARSPEAAGVYQDFAKHCSASADTNVAAMGRMFEGAARRMGLIGNPIEIKGTKLDGKPIDWASYKGKVVLVDFWATWCGPCIAEIPNMKKMHEVYNKRGFEIVAVSIDNSEDAPIKFMEKRQLPWISLHDKRGKDALADYYGIFAIPQAILVDRDGRVVSLSARGAELDRLLEKLIGPAEEKK